MGGRVLNSDGHRHDRRRAGVLSSWHKQRRLSSTMQSEPNTVQTPFQINVADRVKRLPPYLFGKINDLKYRKRRAGVDIIDLGMGNPTDVPDAQVIDKLREAARDERNHRYSVSNGLFNLRREVALRYGRRHGIEINPDTEVLAGLGSKEV